MWAIVKFNSDPEPHIIGIDNSGFARRLATMDDVDWVNVVTGSGYVLGKGDSSQPPLVTHRP